MCYQCGGDRKYVYCGHGINFHSMVNGRCPDGMHFINLEPFKNENENYEADSETVEFSDENKAKKIFIGEGCQSHTERENIMNKLAILRIGGAT